MVRVVVLLGPPGSGKSTIGEELGRLGLRWREWEPWLMERWGGRERFLARKEEALEALHAELLRFIDEGPPAAVIESTGLSDREFIDSLQRESAGAFVVRLDISEEAALQRVAMRPQSRHLSDSAEHNREVWRAFQALVAQRPVDLVIGTESLSAATAAARIVAAMGQHSSEETSANA